MRTLGVMPPMKRRRIARETLEIYAPIAERLGLYAVKLELEDLGFRALYPYRYRVLERELKRARGNQKQFVAQDRRDLQGGARRRPRSPRGVEGREKHLYSIYKKMQNKHISLNEMVDVYGFRIIVDSVDICYRVLGLVHGVYRPMPGRFKDYIAIPRINGYQSLHTTLFGPNGVPIEVQIRSEQMHRVAESGIAAHWKYKTGGESFGGIEHDRAREWLAGLVQIQEGGSSEEFLESVKVDLFPDKVYVFTPKGKILRLPTRCDRGGFRLCDSHRRGQPLRRRQSRPPPRSSAHAAAQRSDRRDHHGQRRDAESLVVDLSRHSQGARRNPPVPQELEARRGGRARQAVARTRARGSVAQLEEDPAGGHRCRGEGAQPRRRGRALREDRPGRTACRSGRAAPAARARRRCEHQQWSFDDRGHRRTARHLRALLLSNPQRSNHGVSLRGPRRNDPPTELR